MRAILPVLYLIILTFLQGCKKDIDLAEEIKGRWQMRKYKQPLQDSRDIQPGDGIIYEFDGKDNFYYDAGSANPRVFKYWTDERAAWNGEKKDFIHFDNSSLILTINGNTLSLQTDGDFVGSYYYEFERI